MVDRHSPELGSGGIELCEALELWLGESEGLGVEASAPLEVPDDEMERVIADDAEFLAHETDSRGVRRRRHGSSQPVPATPAERAP